MSVLIPKGHERIACKNERQRSVVGGEATVAALYNPESDTYVLTVEDHVNDTMKASPILNLRELEVMRDVINDLLWKRKVK